ncbi:DUF899 domain-containing protein [Pararobbsia alpina]|uniref:Thioredoxin domain-containing protein n=1 Tax=Pararobbsia alpina TaxID=621374 RepID=A0A6S7BQI4_9BURK|nr:thioredoxin family protein [Pararobbsia alpina]CAB3792142.1 hypothetical protein LMG28138_03275 [Pararobbsia alpina]
MQTDHAVVSQDQWLDARKALLEREKAYTRMRDELARERRALPWIRVDKPYVFEGPRGRQSLADLFAGRSQLIVQHFMFGPDWEEGCVGCSFQVDHVEGIRVHLEHHDVSFVAVSRAPYAKIEAFRRRMGWQLNWVSSFGSDFNYDFNVSFGPDDAQDGVFYNYQRQPFMIDELPGNSVFYKDDEGQVFHTYSTYGRGFEEVLAAYACLDITPNGRNEQGPGHNLTDWVRHHDRYADSNRAGEQAGTSQAAGGEACHGSVRADATH